MGGTVDDLQLLRRYARARDEAAFAQVVRRHLNLVYSAAARRLGDRHLAQDVTQAVFVILARKAGSVGSSSGPLSAWLLRAVRYAAANALRIEARRRRHEHAAGVAAASTAAARTTGGACSSNPTDVLVWQEVAQRLDDAVLKLPAADRAAVLLRYFEDRPIADVAAALRVSEGAAKMRLGRSLEKLRRRLERAGAALVAPALVAPAGAAAAGLGSMLASHAVRAAPAGLSQPAVAAALGKGAAASGAGMAIAKGAITMMTWTKTKVAAAAVVVAASMLGTGALFTIDRAGAQAQAARDDNTPRDGKAGEKAEGNADGKAGEDENAASLESAPPVVVQTVPQAGADDVDPETAEVRVVYSKDMKDESWSWSTWGEGTFPETTGKPSYEDDRRTCVLPVKLEPGRTYAIWLNSDQFGNFQDEDGRKAVPYLLVFKTKG